MIVCKLLFKKKKREGYIRTSSEAYKTDDLENDFIHLTNNAVQKYSVGYGQFEKGN